MLPGFSDEIFRLPEPHHFLEFHSQKLAPSLTPVSASSVKSVVQLILNITLLVMKLRFVHSRIPLVFLTTPVRFIFVGFDLRVFLGQLVDSHVRLFA